MPRQARIDIPGALHHICEDGPYLLELVRYIHLNPMRAGLVKDLAELRSYPWSGHAANMGPSGLQGQNVDEALG